MSRCDASYKFVCLGWKHNDDASGPNYVGLRYVFVSVGSFSKQNHIMRGKMRRPQKLKVGHYDAHKVKFDG